VEFLTGFAVEKFLRLFYTHHGIAVTMPVNLKHDACLSTFGFPLLGFPLLAGVFRAADERCVSSMRKEQSSA
jgi:hypothetical protein